MYDVTLVQFNGTSGGIQTFFLTGFPASFNYLLASMWVCLPSSGGAISNIGAAGLFGNVNPESDKVRIILSAGTPIYTALFSGPVIGQRYNLLVSVDAGNQIVQVYVNDAPATLTSGGWTGSGPLTQPSGFYAVDLGSSGGFPAVADIWEEATDSFVDLTVRANRRKFINRNLTPVYLGTNGENPFGASPPVYLTVPSGGVATDFETNFGTGGALHTTAGVTLSLQAPDTCSVPSAGGRPLVSIIGRSAPP